MMKKGFFLSVVIFFFIAICGNGAIYKKRIKDMEIIPIKLNCIVDQRNQLVADITLHNTLGKPLTIEKLKICHEGKLILDLFKIKEGDVPIRFSGPLRKLAAPQHDDYYTIKVGETYRATVRIDEKYRFLEGTHSYGIYFNSYVIPEDEKVVYELRSNVVNITYNK